MEKKSTSLWNTILKECAGETKSTDSVKRVLIVGPFYAGKRSLATKLREALGGEKRGAPASQQQHHSASSSLESTESGGASSILEVEANSSAHNASGAANNKRHGSGIDYSFVAIRGADGAVTGNVELYCCDTLSAIDAAIPNLEVVKNLVVIFTVNLGSPSTMSSQVLSWKMCINGRIEDLILEAEDQKESPQIGIGGKNENNNNAHCTCEGLIAARLDSWAIHSEAFSSTRRRQEALRTKDDSVDPPKNTTLVDESGVLLVPGFIIANKMDLYERYCRQANEGGSDQGPTQRSKSSSSALTPVSPNQLRHIGLELLRKQALDMRCGFAAVNLSGGTSFMTNNLCKGIFLWCLDAFHLEYEPPQEKGARSKLNSSFAGSLSYAGSINAVTAELGTETSSERMARILDSLILYDFSENCFLPTGADYYECLSGQVRTSDFVKILAQYFPAEQIKKPVIETHEGMLRAAANASSLGDSSGRQDSSMHEDGWSELLQQ